MRRLWRLLRPEAGALAAACVCMLALALTTAVAVALVGPVLRALLLGAPPDLGVLGGLLPVGLLSSRLGFPALILVLALIKGLAYFGQFQLLARIGQRTSSRLRRTLLSHLLSARPSVLGRHQTGELLSRFQNDATAVEMAVTYALGAYVRDGATALLLLGLCLLLDWRLSLLACAALPLTLVPLARLLKRLRQRVKAASVSQGALGHLVAQGLQGLPSIQVDGLEPQEATRFAVVSAEAVEHQLGSARVRAVLSPLMELAAALGICAMLIVAADSVASGALDGEKLTSFLASALLLVQPLKALGKVGHFAVAGQVSLGRIDELLAETARQTQPTPELAPLRREIVFRDVSYAYSPGALPALDGLNLSLRRGERLALVGPSGAGKSTLFQLLLGLRAPDQGQILYDGQPLAPSSDGLGGQLAWVGQEPFLFDGTVAENIALGQESPDPDRLKLAARRSQSLDFIERMGGFEAEVGERGRKLSGGERQRLCIARALYQDAPLLLLDEPTSHLDPENEHSLRQALDELVKDRTVLLIAHRLATVRGCERAVVLERGRAVEEGRPDDLLSAAGRFAALFGEELWRDRGALLGSSS